jgi:putative uncharacterized protein (fragment)
MDAMDEGEARGIERGKILGLAEGEARGFHQANLETAKNLLGLGLSVETIAKATGLSQAEVETLA